MRFNVQDIDLGITLKIEEVCISLGYYPDINTINPNDQVAMNNAIDSIKLSGKTPVFVYAPNSSRERINTSFNSIFVNRKYYKSGDIGFGTSIALEKENPLETDPALVTWKKVKYADVTCDIEYQIRFQCPNDRSHDVLDEIVFTALQHRMFVYGVNSDRTKQSDGFWVVSSGTPTDVASDDRIERVYRFEAKDVIISQPTILKSGIKSMNTITTELATGSDAENIEEISL